MIDSAIAVDSADPKLPANVIAATQGITAADLAAGDAPNAAVPFVDCKRMFGTDAAAVAGAYSFVVANGGGILYFDFATYSYSADMLWESNKVSIMGAGSSGVIFLPTGIPKIVVRPDPFTIEQGPRFTGFTVRGDPTSPAGAVGIYSGDITGSYWDDVVIENFDGVGSIGLDLDNATNWTERNHFSIRLDNNKVGIRCRRSGPAGMFSFGYNRWKLQFLVNDTQTGWLTEDDVLLYHNDIDVIGNMVDTGNLIDVSDTSKFVAGRAFITAEQTFGVGAVGVRVRSGASFSMLGHRTYSGTMVDVNENTLAGGGTFAPTLRQLAGIAVVGNQRMVMDAGVLPDFIGTEDAYMVPLVAEQLDALYASFGVLTGVGIASPYMTMLDVAGNRIPILAIGPGDTQGEGRELYSLGLDSTFPVNELITVEVNAARTAIPDDKCAVIYSTNAAFTLTFDTFANQPLPIGSRVKVINAGGAVTLAAAGGVTLVPPAGQALTAKAGFSEITALCVALNVWVAGGDLTGS